MSQGFGDGRYGLDSVDTIIDEQTLWVAELGAPSGID
jgi:hypothetical protein